MNQPFDLSNFISALEQPQVAAKMGRALLKQFTEQQFEKFDQGTSVAELIKQRAHFVDQVLSKIWHHSFHSNQFALLAVGGYGRSELHPYSDIDVLILCQNSQVENETIAQFITLLWDMGFEVGHAIRSLDECQQTALEDVSTATNLLEARLITGNHLLFKQLQNLWKLESFWPSQQFFDAKVAEQHHRHNRFHDTVYQLEPNIKESPGGLRDIQTIFWVAKRHFNATSIHQLVEKQFITVEENSELEAAYTFLSRVRFVLHRLKKRREDRLLFDNQQQVAQAFGFDDNIERLAVEQFMNSYYRNVRSVVKLNEILLQHFYEEIFNHHEADIIKINQRFQLVNKYLDVRSEQVFQQFPSALLEIFIIIENDPSIAGVRARTLRLLRESLYLIDESFRLDPINKALFIEIFRQPKGVNASLRRMHSYGILDAYIPAFHKISGLMQFNIFHAYTVDEHTILVIRYLRRFFVKEYAFEFPTAHQVAKSICKPEILFLAGLFHDIAKGRNGAHEVLGADDAYEFCKQHNLSITDTKLVAWLVRHHLEFSSVAQRKDLSDPNVILEFARLVSNQNRLNYLYLLTVADVRSTSDDVWNDWKNSLFLELYNETSNALDKAQEIPRDKAKKAILHQEKSREILVKKGVNVSEYQALWNALQKTEFFSRQTPAEISRITHDLINTQDKTFNLNLITKTQRGASELMLYMPKSDVLFAQITHILDSLNLNIVEAKVYSTTNNMTLMLVYFLDLPHHTVDGEDTLQRIQEKLQKYLAQPDSISSNINHKKSRRIRHFKTPTEIEFRDLSDKLSELTITTKDIPGLLSRIGQAFRACGIRLHDAKINTVGEKAEDTFLISTTDDQAIRVEQQIHLTQMLREYIEA